MLLLCVFETCPPGIFQNHFTAGKRVVNALIRVTIKADFDRGLKYPNLRALTIIALPQKKKNIEIPGLMLGANT